MRGNCALCLKISDLQNSHLLPAAAYKTASQSHTAHNTGPVIVDGQAKTSIFSDKQLTKYLLCSGCEQRFSRLGENHVLAHLHEESGKFKLREIFVQEVAHKNENGRKCHFGDRLSSNVKSENFAYFALSVL